MHITKLSLCNFQNYGPTPVSIELDDLTTFIGTNGSGKTAALLALTRMFGTTPSLRQLVPGDFHVPKGEKREDRDQRALWIEARIDFPELLQDTTEASAVPAMFRHMVIRDEGGVPYCRMRLEGTWSQTLLEEGDVDENFFWIVVPEGEDVTLANSKPYVNARDRSRIHVFYVPANRDTNKQLANVSGTLLHQLLSSIQWTDDMRGKIRSAAGDLRSVFDKIRAIERINEATQRSWGELYDEEVFTTPTLQFVASELSDVLRDTQIVFNPGPGTDHHALTMLSDGQSSLFYFAFINTLFGVRRDVFNAHHAAVAATETDPITQHISYEKLRPAVYTIFAVEEPENHLGPHYLSRIVRQLEQIAANDGAQVLLTSHSAGIISRVDPETIRYFRCDAGNREGAVRAIHLPPKSSDAHKYVKEAVRAYPELYFARMVVLCEGDSEEVLIPKMVRLEGGDLDLSLVSVVPLGGRHVNHFWRLLADLRIPYVTLLDLDRERETGGWERIQYIVNELTKVLPQGGRDALLRDASVSGGDDTAAGSQESLEMRDVTDHDGMHTWIQKLRSYHIFFSEPLDLDFLMLRAFPQEYRETVARGPRNGADGRRRVLGEGKNGTSYTADDLALFPWYSTLFLGIGKPTTHTAAWVQITKETWEAHRPEPLVALLSDIKNLLRSSGEIDAEL